jgi:D-lactate dehydrogenase (cytochrome)
MTSPRVVLQSLLSAADERALAQLVCGGAAAPSLDVLAAALRVAFQLELACDPDIVAGYAQDSSHLPGRADAVCRPRSARECAIMIRACALGCIPCTIAGGRSNLTGSATPEGGVIIALEQLTAPAPTVDDTGGTVQAPAGIILEHLRDEVLRQTCGRWYFPVNPTSRADAQLGGALACNASGFTPGAPGAMRHWVEALDVILPDGMAVTMRRGQSVSADGCFQLVRPDGVTTLPVPRYPRPAVKNASGPFSAPDGILDLVDFFIGSEGIFGIITAATLRLAPSPAAYLDLFFSLPSEAQAIVIRDHLADTLSGGVSSLAALEYFGPHCRRYMDHAARFFLDDNPVGLYIQIPLYHGTPDDAALEWFARLSTPPCNVCEDALMVMDTPRTRQLFFDARHSLPSRTLEIVQQRGTITIMTDAVVPAAHFAEFLAATHARIQQAGLEYTVFGHFGDSHVHFMLLPEQPQLAQACAVYDDIMRTAAALGGVYSGEHGTGKRKRNDFLACYGAAAAGDVTRAKAALDPRFLLNRGTVITRDWV